MEQVTRSARPVVEYAEDTALQRVLAALGTGVAISTEEGRLIDANPSLLQILGRSRDEVLGTMLDDHLGGDLSLTLRDDPADRRERTFVRPDERRVWVRTTDTTVRSQDDRVLLIVTAVEDITDRKALEGALRERALLDPVTGLSNRYLLEDRLEHSLVQRHRTGQELAVLFVDLDDFKTVNDTAGHRAGDLVLRETGRRIAACARAGDTVARWGGDEFVVLCDGVAHERDAQRIVDRIIAACAEPFGAGGKVFTLGASVGLAMTGPPATIDADSLLDLADKRMYAEKAKRHAAG